MGTADVPIKLYEMYKKLFKNELEKNGGYIQQIFELGNLSILAKIMLQCEQDPTAAPGKENQGGAAAGGGKKNKKNKKKKNQIE